MLQKLVHRIYIFIDYLISTTVFSCVKKSISLKLTNFHLQTQRAIGKQA